MKNVLSVRLNDDELRQIRLLAKKEDLGQSQIARHLIVKGLEFCLLLMYKEGKLSLGSLAKDLKLSISQTLDFLESLGISSPLEYEDYLKGLELLR